MGVKRLEKGKKGKGRKGHPRDREGAKLPRERVGVGFLVSYRNQVRTFSPNFQ